MPALREAHGDVIIMPPENFFYLNEAEKEKKRRRPLGRFLSSALDPETPPGD